jgi:hypothetical protein
VLVRDASKVCARLGWQSETSFKVLEVIIVEAETQEILDEFEEKLRIKFGFEPERARVRI